MEITELLPEAIGMMSTARGTTTVVQIIMMAPLMIRATVIIIVVAIKPQIFINIGFYKLSQY